MLNARVICKNILLFLFAFWIFRCVPVKEDMSVRLLAFKIIGDLSQDKHSGCVLIHYCMGRIYLPARACFSLFHTYHFKLPFRSPMRLSSEPPTIPSPSTEDVVDFGLHHNRLGHDWGDLDQDKLHIRVDSPLINQNQFATPSVFPPPSMPSIDEVSKWANVEISSKNLRNMVKNST